MSRGLAVPLFPNAPSEYNAQYQAELVRAFSIFLQQVNNPGPWLATSLTLTNLQSDDYGLAPNGVFQVSGALRISIPNRPYPRGVSASGAVGTVTVTT
jgi:hypothetical protein